MEGRQLKENKKDQGYFDYIQKRDGRVVPFDKSKNHYVYFTLCIETLSLATLLFFPCNLKVPK